jgi:predicted nucleotidyltransferase
MDKAELKIGTEIQEFVRAVKKHINVELIILFGSRARGEALKDSDFDFVIVSPDFKDIFFTDRLKMLYEFWDHSQALEALCYTPAEFNEKAGQISIVREAVREGIDVTAT